MKKQFLRSAPSEEEEEEKQELEEMDLIVNRVGAGGSLTQSNLTCFDEKHFPKGSGLSEKPNCQSDSRAFIAKVWDRRSFGCNSGSSSYVRNRNDNGSY
ncbi:hypothetical protein G5I_14003 [Acromyrmex echinatior]|uniref:Uncharacterized protein n=1 Tax=Acromyrmex echinatior TaxID=103372 RepID=F4X6N5_ACREC|nr:hypothetical protein G5I_14003 [Acromyrmex echinatior]